MIRRKRVAHGGGISRVSRGVAAGTLVSTTYVAILAAGGVPSLIIGTANVAATVLTAGVLFTAFLGLSPLAVVAAASTVGLRRVQSLGAEKM